jgi:hypothetical protein
MTVRAKLNKLGLELVGDISWPEHAAIFSTPFRVAEETGHTLIMYGECPQAEYGGPMGSEQAMQMTRQWVTEFGGFLGLRSDDFVGMEGITERDMVDYRPISQWEIDQAKIEAHFLGQYIAWDSRRNAEVAKAHGMRTLGQPPSRANWWEAENLDCAMTGVHDWFMFRKFHFGRGCQQISVDIRSGLVDRDFALQWVAEHDGIFPDVYAGIPFSEVLDRIGITQHQLREIATRFEGATHAG